MKKLRNYDPEKACKSFPGEDRFDLPCGIKRVTGGTGGECFLITGSKKTAIYDTGMAYCADRTVENIEKELDGRPLDYVLLSHSHYDHLGALPQIRKRWKNLKAVGSEYAAYVLTRDGAKKTMKRLGEEAKALYGDKSSSEVMTDGLGVDMIVKDRDKISLGDKEILVLETPGHTNCSLSFAIEPDKILFASESTGLIATKTKFNTAILKSYEDAMASYEKCKAYGAKTIMSPHYGRVPEYHNEKYWESFKTEAEKEKKFIEDMYSEGLTMEEMLERYAEEYWKPSRAAIASPAAFLENAKATIKLFAGNKA